MESRLQKIASNVAKRVAPAPAQTRRSSTYEDPIEYLTALNLSGDMGKTFIDLISAFCAQEAERQLDAGAEKVTMTLTLDEGWGLKARWKNMYKTEGLKALVAEMSSDEDLEIAYANRLLKLPYRSEAVDIMGEDAEELINEGNLQDTVQAMYDAWQNYREDMKKPFALGFPSMANIVGILATAYLREFGYDVPLDHDQWIEIKEEKIKNSVKDMVVSLQGQEIWRENKLHVSNLVEHSNAGRAYVSLGMDMTVGIPKLAGPHSLKELMQTKIQVSLLHTGERAQQERDEWLKGKKSEMLVNSIKLRSHANDPATKTASRGFLLRIQKMKVEEWETYVEGDNLKGWLKKDVRKLLGKAWAKLDLDDLGKLPANPRIEKAFLGYLTEWLKQNGWATVQFRKKGNALSGLVFAFLMDAAFDLVEPLSHSERVEMYRECLRY